MNKYQEALNKIVKSCCPNCTTNGCKDCSIEKICNATAKSWVDRLQELVDKATPKKVKIIYDDDWDEFGNRMIFEERCPICNEDIGDVGGAYCHSCGQALDWSDEDDDR